MNFQDEDDGEEDSDEYEVETMPEQDDGLDDLEGLPIGNGQADGEVDPRARAARWFSNPMFEDVEAEEQAIQLGKRKGKAQVNGDADMESSEDEEEVDEESEGEEEVEGEEVETSEDDEDYEPEDEDMEASASEAEEGDSEESEEEQDDSYGNIPLPLLTAEKKKALLERKSKQQAENLKRLAATGIVDFEQEDLPDPESFADLLKDISKSDRDRRKDKLRKAREKCVVPCLLLATVSHQCFCCFSERPAKRQRLMLRWKSLQLSSIRSSLAALPTLANTLRMVAVTLRDSLKSSWLPSES